MTPAVSVAGPLVGVSAIVVRDGLIVVGRRKGSHGAGNWAFPGGKLEPGEHPGDVVRRELDEETGLQTLRVTTGDRMAAGG